MDDLISYNALLEKLEERWKKIADQKAYGWEYELNGINTAILLAVVCRMEAVVCRMEAKEEDNGRTNQ